MNVALLGNQNSGKTSLFNCITKKHGHVGNFPGITMQINTAALYSDSDIIIYDLPGTYSLSAVSDDEQIAAGIFDKIQFDLILNVVDSTSMQRGLYLTLQLLELGIPTIVALNMIDELENNGGSVSEAGLEKCLPIKAVKISAAKNIGISHLIKLIMERDFPKPSFLPWIRCGFYSSALERIEQKYKYIDKICDNAVIQGKESLECKRSERLDYVLTGKYTAIPIFALIMAFIFYCTFDLLGGNLSGLVSSLTDNASSLITNKLGTAKANSILLDLLENGIFAGFKTLAGFLPIILILSFFLSLLEDSGYMARIVFIMDKPLTKIGLSGKSFVPLILGFGCTVPAVIASRTLSSKSERIRTALLTPLMSCSAKIPVYMLLAGIFFPSNQAWIVISLYTTGLLVLIFCGAATASFTKSDSLILELPNYRIPRLTNLHMLIWEKCREFVKRVFGIVLLSSVIVWFLSRLSPSLAMAENISESILASIGHIAAPLFAPLGFGSLEAVTALLSGILAKESIASALFVLCNGNIRDLFTTSGAYGFLIFTLFYPPCIPALTVIKNELGGLKYAAASFIGQLILAWVAALLATTIIP